MCVPQRVVSDFGGCGRCRGRVEGQALLCEVDAAMALYAVVLEEVAELSEELCSVSEE